MSRRKWIAAGTASVAGLLAWAAWKGSRAGYETAAYAVVSEEGDFEIRDYEGLVLVATEMKETDQAGMDAGFKTLFGYITGENAGKAKIAMTTPVFVSEPGEEGSMAFVVPKEVAEAGAPVPSNAAVVTSALPAMRCAVLRFKGSRSVPAAEAARKRLEDWVQAKGLKPTGPCRFAYYDPPWIPEFLTRNEVLVPVGK